MAGKHGFTDLLITAPTAHVTAHDATKPSRPARVSGVIAGLSLLGCLWLPLASAGCSASAADDATGPDAVWPKPAAIPLSSFNELFWGTTLSIGTQSFFVDIDTGSATTAVAGASCTSCASAGVLPLYKPGASAMDQRQTASAVYLGMDGWSGEVFTDKVSLGQGTPELPLAFAAITDDVMQFLPDNSRQGILGLGPSENAVPHTDAYIAAAEQSGADPVLAFELCPTGGTMWIGGFDATRAAAAPGYTPMVPITRDQQHYAVHISSMSIGSTSVATAADFQSSPLPPVVDTGTTLFIAPKPVVTSTLAAVNASPGFKALFGDSAALGTIDTPDTFGCVAGPGVTTAMVDAMLPPLTMTLPGKVAGSPDLSFTVKPTVSYIIDAGDGQWCFTLLDDPSGLTILGDTIMRAFVTIIDRANQQVGWAPDRGCTLDARRHPAGSSSFHDHLADPRLHRRRGDRRGGPATSR